MERRELGHGEGYSISTSARRRGGQDTDDIDQDGAKNSEDQEDTYEAFGKAVGRPQGLTEDRESVVWQMKVTAAKIGRYGTTGNCPGCEAYLSNRTGVTHNHDCRSRIRALREKDEEGQQELAQYAERVKRRTEELLRKESVKDPKVAGEGAPHDE